MKICAGSATHVGHRRNNQDSLLAEPELGLFAVADGVGGENGGEIASRVAIEALGDFYQRTQRDSEPDVGRVAMAFRIAQRKIVDLATGELERMATTLVAMRVVGRRAIIAHVGDSRAYRMRDGELSALTIDHTIGAQLVQVSGSRESSRFAEALTRALASSCDSRADVTEIDVAPGDVFLLASDGVTKPLHESEIAAILCRADASAAAHALTEAAIGHGGRDNATAIVVRIEP